MVPSDTSSKALDIYFQRLAEMTPSERVRIGVELCKAADSLQRAAARRRNPSATEAEINLHIATTRFGSDLAQAVYRLER